MPALTGNYRHLLKYARVCRITVETNNGGCQKELHFVTKLLFLFTEYERSRNSSNSGSRATTVSSTTQLVWTFVAANHVNVTIHSSLRSVIPPSLLPGVEVFCCCCVSGCWRGCYDELLVLLVLIWGLFDLQVWLKHSESPNLHIQTGIQTDSLRTPRWRETLLRHLERAGPIVMNGSNELNHQE